MAKGGHREGAGRKKGSANLLTQKLREQINAPRLIRLLQEIADGTVEGGASVAERKDAAIALLRKVLPDCRTEDVGASTAPTTVVIHSNVPMGFSRNKENFDLIKHQ
ncbi:MAG: hypothetical protein ACD_62C00169G0009 [uncultured bacterium]|nr:MAG: hypothetical protein ACD_62C00169G0009 [uncultured bacterium]